MFSELCNPAKIYLVFSLIGIVLDIVGMVDTKSYDVYAFLVLFLTIAFHYAWLMLLQYFCKKGMEGVSWFILFLPFIFVLLFFFFFGVSLTYIIANSNIDNIIKKPTILPTTAAAILATTSPVTSSVPTRSA